MPATTINVNFDYRQMTMVQDLDPAVDTSIFGFLNGGAVYEQDIAHVMMRALRPSDVAIDVGANIGFFTVMMANLVGPDGHVIGYEPGEDNLVRLHRNIAVSGMQNVTVVTQPVSDAAAPVHFFLNSDVPGGHALWDPGSFPGNTKSLAQARMVRTTTTTLDAEMARLGLPAPRLIKIDTEGAERRVLAGAAGLLRDRAIPYIIAELHEFGLAQLGSSQQDLRAFMAGFGYDTFGLYFDGTLPKLIPPQTALHPPHIINLLFSTAEAVGQLWPEERFDPRLGNMQRGG